MENNNWIFSDEYKEMIENIGQITKDLSPKFFTVCQNNLKLNSILKTNTNPEMLSTVTGFKNQMVNFTRLSKQLSVFLACMGYPKCKTTAFVEADFVEEYFNRNGGTGQKCLRCKYSLKAEKGIYGVYIHCCGQPVHKYKLDEI